MKALIIIRYNLQYVMYQHDDLSGLWLPRKTGYRIRAGRGCKIHPFRVEDDYGDCIIDPGGAPPLVQGPTVFVFQALMALSRAQRKASVNDLKWYF